MTTVDLNGIAALSHLGVIRAEGPDAASFLHGQLTQDVAQLGPSEARLAALCTPKGRMMASFIVIRPLPEQVFMICSQDILAATQKRLSMFVMRAKVKLSDATSEFALYGVAGTALAANDIDAAARPDHRTAVCDGASAVSLYSADGVPRALWIASPDSTAPRGPALDAALWAWSEVRSGIVTLSAPIVEAFVPQMLNYESVGGVSFKKGCYPGQEIVARSQFRGTLKRRAFLVHAAEPVSAGQEVFAGNADQPVGTVAQAAEAPGGGFDALVSMQISALERGGLHAGAVDGPALTVEALPYPLLEDV